MAGAVFAAEPLVVDTVFVAFDTETTGFSPKNDRIVEIGAVKFRGNGEILAVTNWLINPERDIPLYATEVHGIRSGDVRMKPLFKEVFPQFAAFCDGAVLLAHNAPFDVNFLKAELKRANIDAPALPVLDTLPLFRAWFPRALSHSLEPLSVYLCVQNDTYHRAEADSSHLIDIFNVGMKHRSQLQLQRLESDSGGLIWLDGKNR
ncbi:MAG: 3'-5' exonuclease [Kiritimatiellales bacterium]|nr:3'-5' exonuclease [Kiritimatiellales bacterium]